VQPTTTDKVFNYQLATHADRHLDTTTVWLSVLYLLASNLYCWLP